MNKGTVHQQQQKKFNDVTVKSATSICRLLIVKHDQEKIYFFIPSDRKGVVLGSWKLNV